MELSTHGARFQDRFLFDWISSSYRTGSSIGFLQDRGLGEILANDALGQRPQAVAVAVGIGDHHRAALHHQLRDMPHVADSARLLCSTSGGYVV